MEDIFPVKATFVSLAALAMFGASQASCSPCSFQWEESGQNCYRYFPVSLPYDEALSYCQHHASRGEPGGLMTGGAREEATFLLNYVGDILSTTTTHDAAPSCIWLGKTIVDTALESYSMAHHNALGVTTETGSHFTSCDAYDTPVAISDVSAGTGISKMIPSPDVVEQKCSVYVGDGAFIDLGDFAGSCVSDPDVCTSESVTWSLWIKINSSADLTHDNVYISTGGHTSGGRGVLFMFRAHEENPFWLHVRLQRKPSVFQKYNVSKIPMNKWVHFAIALDMNHTNAKMAMYLDGEKLAPDFENDMGLKSPNDGCTRLVLGNFDACDGTGRLSSSASAAYSNLMVFDHLLTEEQIGSLYACGSLDWGLKIRSLDIDKSSSNPRYVCKASSSEGLAINWSVYHKEQAEWQDLGGITSEEGYEITPTSFSPCVVQSTLVIDQAHGLVAEGDIVTCTAISGAQNASVHIRQVGNETVGLYNNHDNAELFMANAGQDYYRNFYRSGGERQNGACPFICKNNRRY